tara:strand:- start:2235 stop:2648 length:414 start_codon:yes stop_codon:yes gene_type:complete
MPNEILPGIWIGYGNDINNEKFILQKNINCIISTVNINKNIEVIHIPIENNNKLFIEYIYDIVNFIYKKYINYKNILIYCKNGTQLSPSIVVCFLVKYCDIDIENAIKFIKTKSNKSFIDNCILKKDLNIFINNYKK